MVEGVKMEFDEHEEEEIGTRTDVRKLRGGWELRGTKENGGGGGYRYRECLKNHAVAIGGQAVDGCGEFMPAGDEGTLEALKCAACDCHRNFHRKEPDVQLLQANTPHQQMTPPAYYYHRRPSGYLQVTSPSDHHQRPLALPSTSRDDLGDMSNPSSGGGGSRKRFRTKFTPYQKDRMLPFAEELGWRIQRADEAAVQQFCPETAIKR